MSQAGLLSRATSSNSCRKNMGLSKVTSDSNLCRKAGYSLFLLADTPLIKFLATGLGKNNYNNNH
jgi:hypothetical protein